MIACRPLLAQVLSLVPRSEFEKLVREHGGQKHVRSFPCWSQFACLVYAQLSRQHSLRDLVLALETKTTLLYHCFGTREVRRTTLADANERRPYKIYEDLFRKLYQQCLTRTPRHKFRFRGKLYSFDASIVRLCLSVFPWAKYRTKKGGIKLHTLLDHEGHIPSFVSVTAAKIADVREARQLMLEPDSILTFDRGYIDYAWFYRLHLQGVGFVSRFKRRARIRVLERHDPPPLSGVTSDQTVRIAGNKPDSFPADLRRIGYRDPATGQRYYYITNIFRLSAKTIAEIYRSRWQVELFFKWIKQHLRIKTFIGTSENAVMSQVYVAMITYLLIAYMKFSSNSPLTLYELAKRMEVSLFDRLALRTLLARHPHRRTDVRSVTQPIQLSFTWDSPDWDAPPRARRVRIA